MVFGKDKEKPEETQEATGNPEQEQGPKTTEVVQVSEDKKESIGRAVSEAERFLTKARDILKIGSMLQKEVSKAELKRLYMACKRASQDLESELKAMRRAL